MWPSRLTAMMPGAQKEYPQIRQITLKENAISDELTRESDRGTREKNYFFRRERESVYAKSGCEVNVLTQVTTAKAKERILTSLVPWDGSQSACALAAEES